MATIHHLPSNLNQARTSQLDSRPRLTHAPHDRYRRISAAEELRLLEAARAEDKRLSPLRRVKELAAPELAASDLVVGKAARLKARRAALRRARALVISTEHQTVPQCETFIRLLLELGFRQGEALALLWSDVNEQAKTVSLQGWKNKPGRTFRISTDLLALLQRLPCTSPHVFDFRYRALSTSWLGICRSSGLDTLRLDNLRYEAVCRVVASGRMRTSSELQAFLGYAPVRWAHRFVQLPSVF